MKQGRWATKTAYRAKRSISCLLLCRRSTRAREGHAPGRLDRLARQRLASSSCCSLPRGWCGAGRSGGAIRAITSASDIDIKTAGSSPVRSIRGLVAGDASDIDRARRLPAVHALALPEEG